MARHIHRDEWTQFHDKRYARRRILFHGRETETQRMYIGHADAPFSVKCGDKRLVIADDGYSWLQIAPEGGSWWLTAMLNPAGEMLQYYFDLTAGNVLTDGADAYFEDMYLDVVMHADGTVLTLDADELDEACRSGKITREQHRRTLDAAEALKNWLKQPETREEIISVYRALETLPLVRWDEL